MRKIAIQTFSKEKVFGEMSGLELNEFCQNASRYYDGPNHVKEYGYDNNRVYVKVANDGKSILYEQNRYQYHWYQALEGLIEEEGDDIDIVGFLRSVIPLVNRNKELEEHFYQKLAKPVKKYGYLYLIKLEELGLLISSRVLLFDLPVEDLIKMLQDGLSFNEIDYTDENIYQLLKILPKHWEIINQYENFNFERLVNGYSQTLAEFIFTRNMAELNRARYDQYLGLFMRVHQHVLMLENEKGLTLFEMMILLCFEQAPSSNILNILWFIERIATQVAKVYPDQFERETLYAVSLVMPENFGFIPSGKLIDEDGSTEYYRVSSTLSNPFLRRYFEKRNMRAHVLCKLVKHINHVNDEAKGLAVIETLLSVC